MSRPKSKPMRQALPMIKHAIKSYEITTPLERLYRWTTWAKRSKLKSKDIAEVLGVSRDKALRLMKLESLPDEKLLSKMEAMMN